MATNLKGVGPYGHSRSSRTPEYNRSNTADLRPRSRQKSSAPTGQNTNESPFRDQLAEVTALLETARQQLFAEQRRNKDKDEIIEEGIATLGGMQHELHKCRCEWVKSIKERNVATAALQQAQGKIAVLEAEVRRLTMTIGDSQEASQKLQAEVSTLEESYAEKLHGTTSLQAEVRILEREKSATERREEQLKAAFLELCEENEQSNACKITAERLAASESRAKQQALCEVQQLRIRCQTAEEKGSQCAHATKAAERAHHNEHAARLSAEAAACKAMCKVVDTQDVLASAATNSREALHALGVGMASLVPYVQDIKADLDLQRAKLFLQLLRGACAVPRRLLGWLSHELKRRIIPVIGPSLHRLQLAAAGAEVSEGDGPAQPASSAAGCAEQNRAAAALVLSPTDVAAAVNAPERTLHFAGSSSHVMHSNIGESVAGSNSNKAILHLTTGSLVADFQCAASPSCPASREISSNSACTADRHGGATQKESMRRPIIQRSPTQHSTDDSMPDNHSAPSSGDTSQEHKTADRLPSWSETSMSSAAPAPPQSSSAKRRLVLGMVMGSFCLSGTVISFGLSTAKAAASACVSTCRFPAQVLGLSC